MIYIDLESESRAPTSAIDFDPIDISWNLIFSQAH